MPDVPRAVRTGQTTFAKKGGCGVTGCEEERVYDVHITALCPAASASSAFGAFDMGSEARYGEGCCSGGDRRVSKGSARPDESNHEAGTVAKRPKHG